MALAPHHESVVSIMSKALLVDIPAAYCKVNGEVAYFACPNRAGLGSTCAFGDLILLLVSHGYCKEMGPGHYRDRYLYTLRTACTRLNHVFM
jgi:hypothetical protein